MASHWGYALLYLFTINSVVLIFTNGWASSSERPPVYLRTLSGANNLSVILHSNGNYEVKQNGTGWLHSGPTFFQSCWRRFSTDLDNLHMKKLSNVESGQDNIGEFQYVSTTWELPDCEFKEKCDYNSSVVTSIRVYKSSPLIVFSQNFNNVSLFNTSTEHQTMVSTGFPTFLMGTSKLDLGYISYGTNVLMQAWVGKWQRFSVGVQPGLRGGPLVLFDKKQKTMMIAPFREFLSSSIYHDRLRTTVDLGVMGLVEEIPKDYKLETAIYFDEGIKSTMFNYGDLLLKHYGKTTKLDTDFTSNYLGYWTDNGAFYYNNTEKDMTYDETLMQVKSYADSVKIPYRYFQLDSWWYYRGEYEGTKNWTARPDIFPKGLADFKNRLGLPLAAHNRYWANDTSYAKDNGGDWNFIVNHGAKSIAVDTKFWNYLMSTSRDWGLIMYEQDWLEPIFESLEIILSNVSLAETWMDTMAQGMAMNDIAVLFSWPAPRFLLYSVKMPTVTQARASFDYQPGLDQWNIGLASILYHALGLKPFKDTFWTTKSQPGNPYGLIEHNPEIHALVATLSTGPVGPGDKLGHSNAKLIMRSCNAEGKLLQPSRPAMTVAGSIIALAFGYDAPGALNASIWSTVSAIPLGGFDTVFGTILVLEVAEKMLLKPSDADLNNGTDIYKLPPLMAYRDDDPLNTVVDFDEDTPLTLRPEFDVRHFKLWHTSPKLNLRNNTVVILGELKKWVKVSPDRITDISLTLEALFISMTGAPKERVKISLMFNMKPMHTKCEFPESGEIVLKVMDMKKYDCVTT